MYDLEQRYEGAKQKIENLEEKKLEIRPGKEAVPSATTAPLDLSVSHTSVIRLGNAISDGKAQVIMHTRQDVYQFMSVLPKPIERLRQNKLEPIGLNSMDLKTYVAAVCIETSTQCLVQNY